MIEITPLEDRHLPDAAGLFVESYRELRRRTPTLPDELAQPGAVCPRLEKCARAGRAIAALKDGELVGYLAWFEIDSFRAAGRKAGFSPEWAHAAKEGSPAVIRALYRAASQRWWEAGCNTHAITVLAHETRAIETWSWNGFGIGVVDGVRSLEPLGAPIPAGFRFRPAGLADAAALAEIEAEHWQHYPQPPVLMEAHAPDDAEAFRKFLRDSCNSAWMAETAQGLAGYLRFESSSNGAAVIVQGQGTVAITGAYTRPAYRGQGAAPALLDAALQSFRAQGFTRCSVDFESFNPEAASFWPKYFDTVCLSMIRVPERQPT